MSATLDFDVSAVYGDEVFGAIALGDVPAQVSAGGAPIESTSTSLSPSSKSAPAREYGDG